MDTTIDSAPDPLVAALQSADSHLIAARLELRPVLLFVEQRQRMRDRARQAKEAQNAPKESAQGCHPERLGHRLGLAND